MAQYTIDIVPDYEVPAGPLTVEQYVEFVMNYATKSYKSSYDTVDTVAGLAAACAAHNEALPAEAPPEE